MTTGSSVGTNASAGTARLTPGAFTLNATVELTSSTNIVLVTIGVQDTGRWTVGASATERRAAGTRRMTRGAKTMSVMAGIRVTGKRVAGVKRTSVTTNTTKRSGSVTPSSRV